MDLQFNLNIFLFLAGLSLVFFGLKLLSTRQQELASGLLLKLLQGIKEKDPLGIVRGVFFSFLTCSTIASAGTVISLVNAGLIRLRSGIFLIAGANLGTSLIALILSMLEPRLFPLFLGIGFLPYIILPLGQMRHAGGVLFGLGMILVGFHFMSLGTNIYQELDFYQNLQVYLLSSHIGGFVVAAVLGHILTCLFRSSLVVFGMALALLIAEAISLNNGLGAMVGLNIGSAFLSMRMASEGNVYGRRAAITHRIFNWAGAFIYIFAYALFLKDLQWPFSNELVLGLSHVGLNFTMVIIFFLQPKQINNLAIKLVPDEEINEQYELEVLGRATDMIPSLAILQARYHIIKLKNVLDRLFDLTITYIFEEDNSARALAKIKNYERITDNMRTEITEFLGCLIENPLSNRQALHVQMLVRLAVDLEDIGDYLDKLATYNTRHRAISKLSPESKNEFRSFFVEIREFYYLVTNQLSETKAAGKGEIDRQAQALKIAAEGLRETHLSRMEKAEHEAITLMTYSDMVVCLRKIRGHTLKIFNSYYAMTNKQ